MEWKNFFLEIERSLVLKSWQMVQNLFKNFFWGAATIFQPATPQNVIATDDAGSNFCMSVSTGRKVMTYGSKSAEIPCFYLRYEETFLYFQHKKKVPVEKQKLRPFLVIFLENSPTSNSVRSTVV